MRGNFIWKATRKQIWPPPIPGTIPKSCLCLLFLFSPEYCFENQKHRPNFEKTNSEWKVGYSKTYGLANLWFACGVAFHKKDGNHENDENDEDTQTATNKEFSAGLTDITETMKWRKPGTQGAKPRVPQTTGGATLGIPGYSRSNSQNCPHDLTYVKTPFSEQLLERLSELVGRRNFSPDSWRVFYSKLGWSPRARVKES